jgi:hypothetical protein
MKLGEHGKAAFWKAARTLPRTATLWTVDRSQRFLNLGERRCEKRPGLFTAMQPSRHKLSLKR